MLARECWLFLLAISSIGNLLRAEDRPVPAIPQIQFTVKIIETEVNRPQMGFDWVSANGVFPGPFAINNGVPPVAVGAEQVNGQHNSQGVATITGIMTDPQFRTVIRALEQQGNTRLLAEINGSTLVGNPLTVERADGWVIKLVPAGDLHGQTVIFKYEIHKKQGEYAGFSLASQIQVQSGESAIFSDDYNFVVKGKKKPALKRLMILLKPLIISPGQ